jgi:peroxiredoxin-like protein
MSLLNSYSYELNLDWVGRRAGRAEADGLPPLEISAPPEFSGQPGIWTPEHLLVAATASCLLTTYLAIAALSKLETLAWRMRAYGRLEKVPGEGYRFTEITLAPEIEVAAEDVERAEKVLAKAEKGCFISNSLRAKVQVEPKIVAAASVGTGR